MIRREDLEGDLGILADICGMETVRKVMREMNGLTIYIPKISRLHVFIDRYLEDNPERDLKLIACDLGVSATFIRKRLGLSR